jgi:hypothetical protein
MIELQGNWSTNCSPRTLGRASQHHCSKGLEVPHRRAKRKSNNVGRTWGYACFISSLYPEMYPQEGKAADVRGGRKGNASLTCRDGRRWTSTDVYGWLPGPDSNQWEIATKPGRGTTTQQITWAWFRKSALAVATATSCDRATSPATKWNALTGPAGVQRRFKSTVRFEPGRGEAI